MKKRIGVLSLLLALTLLFSSCGVIIVHRPGESEEETSPVGPVADETGEKETAAPVTLPEGVNRREQPDYRKQAQEALDALPMRDMKDLPFLILTSDPSPYSSDLFKEEEEGSVVSRAYLERSDLLNKKYGVTLITTTLPEGGFFDAVSQAVKSGTYLCDLIELPADQLGLFAARSLLSNMNALPFTDYTAPYFDQEATAQCSAGYFTYGVVGRANVYPDKLECLFSNVSVNGSLFRTVYGGDWTWDVFFDKAEKTPEGKSALLSSVLSTGRTALASIDAHLLDTAYGKLPEARDPAPVEKAVTIAAALNAMTAQSESPLSDFVSGKSAFYLGHVSDMKAVSPAPFEWEMLPLPKADAEQTAYSTRGGYQTVFCTISTMASTEVTGLIVQALNAASTDSVSDAWANEALRHYVQRSDTANMIPYIAMHVSYDFAYMMQSNYNSVRVASTDAFEDAIENGKTFFEGYKKGEKNLIRWNPENFVWK